MSDILTVATQHTACEGLSDLGIGPNKPAATIIGESSAPYNDGALTYLLGSGQGENFRI